METSEQDVHELAKRLGARLVMKGLKLATAESCTGGLIGHLLTNVPGISACLMEGVVAYSGEAKMRTLDVPRELIEQYGQVSQEVAEAMAMLAERPKRSMLNASTSSSRENSSRSSPGVQPSSAR